jgi:hypothetical protein
VSASPITTQAITASRISARPIGGGADRDYDDVINSIPGLYSYLKLDESNDSPSFLDSGPNGFVSEWTDLLQVSQPGGGYVSGPAIVSDGGAAADVQPNNRVITIRGTSGFYPDQISIVYWTRVPSVSISTQIVISKWESWASAVQFSTVNNNFKRGGGNVVAVDASPEAVDGNNHLYVHTFSLTDFRQRVWRDAGVLADERSVIGKYDASPLDIVVGAFSGGNAPQFRHLYPVDNIAIYESELTQQDVANIYKAGA